MQFREAAWDEGQAGGLPGGGCTVRDGRSQERCSGQENCMCQGLGWGEKELGRRGNRNKQMCHLKSDDGCFRY